MLAKRLLAFAAAILVVLVATVVSVRSRDGTWDLTGTGCQEPCNRFEIVWVGDIMLGNRAQRHLDQYGYEWPFERVRPLLADAFVIGNAEAPITTRTEPYFPQQRYSYNADPAAAAALASVGFDALGLSNNHAMDRGPEGLRDTIHHAQEAGLRTFGAGMSDAEASAPLLVETGYGAVAVLGFGRAWKYGALAGPDRAGTMTYTTEAIAQMKQSATAAGARWVVAYVHWGENYEPVNDEQRRAAEAFAQAGYDLVIGTHAHLAQEVDIVRGMPVLYSLGNFTFGTSGDFSRSTPGYSVVARTAFGPEGLASIELTCIATDNEVVNYQPRPCSGSQSQALMRRLGSAVTLKGETGVVSWPRRQG
jgi:poly-gamma-glutamate capsule biosynthesis protein CapA/YwtB (metallophosphatase superfamily)